jgi:hypothetical protein
VDEFTQSRGGLASISKSTSNIAPEPGALGTVTMKDSQLPNRRSINAAPSSPTLSTFGANELRRPSLDSPQRSTREHR